MDAMDSAEFNRYFGRAMVAIDARPDQVAELPTALSYYSSPDDSAEPVSRLEAGTRVILYFP